MRSRFGLSIPVANLVNLGVFCLFLKCYKMYLEDTLNLPIFIAATIAVDGFLHLEVQLFEAGE